MTTIEALAAFISGLSTDEKTELLSLVDKAQEIEKSNYGTELPDIKPKLGEYYYHLNGACLYWDDCDIDSRFFSNGFCFPTEKMAKKVARRQAMERLFELYAYHYKPLLKDTDNKACILVDVNDNCMYCSLSFLRGKCDDFADEYFRFVFPSQEIAFAVIKKVEEMTGGDDSE